jgi:hypothetical protein
MKPHSSPCQVSISFQISLRKNAAPIAKRAFERNGTNPGHCGNMLLYAPQLICATIDLRFIEKMLNCAKNKI